MIPVDIDNFNITAVGYRCKGSIFVNKIIEYIPKEIKNCRLLRSLYLANNRIIDISPLSNCPSMQHLDISGNKIIDISVLSSKLNSSLLRALNLAHNPIVDFSTLSKLLSLTNLYLDNIQLSNLPDLSFIPEKVRIMIKKKS